jgi:pyrroloquinoline quinone biosynthesis protein B
MLQSSVALSPDGEHWYLVNASPDIRAQIEAFPALHPRGAGTRNTPLAGVLLTNADLDHVLGLFELRGHAWDVWATEAARHCLEHALGLGAVMNAFGEIRWHSLAHESAGGGLRFRTIQLPASPPRYAIQSRPPSHGHSVAFEIEGEAGTLVIAPDVSEITPELDAALERASAVLFDGTFWCEDELQKIDPKARGSREMGHLPVQSSLARLSRLSASVKAYVHINNTNPILAPGSSECAAVEAAGLRVASDGFEFDV